MKSRFRSMLGCAAAAVLAMSAAAHAGGIYQDNFARTGELNGSSPAPVNTPGATYTSAAGAFSSNGGNATANLTKPGTFSGYNAFLPVTVGASTLTYSITLTPNAGSTTDWLAAGFSDSAGINSGFYQGAVNGEAWVLYRDNGEVQSFFGGGTNNGATSATTATPGAPDTFTFSVNPTTDIASINDTLGLVSRTFALSPTQVSAIQFAGFGNYQTELGTFSNLAVSTPAAAPEPASCGLLAASALGLLARRRSHKNA